MLSVTKFFQYIYIYIGLTLHSLSLKLKQTQSYLQVSGTLIVNAIAKHLNERMNALIYEKDNSFSEDQSGSNYHVTEVNDWLKAQFSSVGKHVPKFEYNFQSISHLHRLSKLSQANTKAALIVTNDLQQRAAEYSSQAARIRELLETAGLGEKNLPQNVNSSIKVVANVANLLNLKDTEISSFLIAFGDLCLKKSEVAEKRIKSGRESQILLDRTRKAITKMANFRRILQQLEDGVVTCEDQMRKWESNLETMSAKEKQYKQQHANFKELLNRVGYSPDISHQVLVELAEHKYELEEKTIPLIDTLRRYRNLPPDTKLAYLAIQDKTREYELAEQYLEELLLALNTTA